jgi:hypothetical protein
VLRDLVYAELALRPAMAERDLCKMLYQASRGADHLLGDRGRFAAELLREWEGLDLRAPRGEPPLQPISPSGGVYRAHLAPLRNAGCAAEAVAEVLSGQPLLDGGLRAYVGLHRRAVELAGSGVIPFDPARLSRARGGGGPVHHSPDYGICSYRVVNGPETAAALLALIPR